jgi:hypothetical protein
MKHRRRNAALWIIYFALAATTARAATLPADWKHEQAFEVPDAGLAKLGLPIETLDAARPELEDLRLYDEAGNEVPYLIEHPMPTPRIFRAAKSFQTTLDSRATVITLETGLTNLIDAVTLETPLNNLSSFTKSTLVEGSTNGHDWRVIVQGRVIYGLPTGMGRLQIDLPPHSWNWLRITVDDQRSRPVPFTGASLQTAAGPNPPSEEVALTIVDRQDSPGESRLTLRLPAANLHVWSLAFDSPEPLFKRVVTLAVSQIEEDAVQERQIGSGVIQSLAVQGPLPSTNLTVFLYQQVRSRELLALIHNEDSPPLPVNGVRAKIRPVYLEFLAKQAGAYHLLTGNSKCTAPQYDLAAFRSQLSGLALAPMKFSPLTNNPAYVAREVLGEVQDNGTLLDVSTWQLSKPIKITRSGAQQLEFDLELLSHAQPSFADVRLMRDGRQLAYILQRTSIQRTFTPDVTMTNDARDPKLSRWVLKLPQPGLPLTRLVCLAHTPLFQREMVALEELPDEHGEKYERTLGRASWTHTPGGESRTFTLPILSAPRGDTIILEAQNGDNPPIELDQFQFCYPVTRMLFKARTNDALTLYYANSDASEPRYDLSLVANELFAADKATASLGAEERLNKATYRVVNAGKGGVIFWGILALVVVALLVVIARLLPKSDVQPPK